MRNIFAERVEQRLTFLKLSRSDLARRLEVTPQGITKTLNEGRRPQLATVKRWAEALETTSEYLLGHDAPAAVTSTVGPTAQELEALLAMSEAIGLDEKRLNLIALVLGHNEAAVNTLELASKGIRNVDAARLPRKKRDSG